MKSFIEKKAYLSEKEINELLYYYEQGIEIGKEDTKLAIINNLIKLNMDKTTISNVVNMSETKLNQLLN